VYLPAALLVPPPLAYVHKAFNLLWQFWLHTRVIDRLPGGLELVLNTPSHHRVHHGRNPWAIDRNFGAVLIVWDRLFGTFFDESWAPGAEALVYGVVPPIRGFSPIWSSLVEWQSLAERVIAAPGLFDKMSILWHGPGWRYSAKAGRCRSFDVPPVGHRFNPAESYDPPLPHPLVTAYATAVFLHTVALFFMSSAWAASAGSAAVAAAVFGSSLHCVTALLEGGTWAPRLELARLVVLGAAFVVAVHPAAATLPFSEASRQLLGTAACSVPFQAVTLSLAVSGVLLMAMLAWGWLRGPLDASAAACGKDQ